MPTLSPTPRPTRPTPSPTCLLVTISPTSAPQTVDYVAQAADVVVIARIDAIGPARWNTLDGTQPLGDSPATEYASIYRPVSITTERMLRGSGPPITSVRLSGGDIDCSGVWYGNVPEVSPGHRYVLPLVSGSAGAAGAADGPWLFWAWPVNANGTIATPDRGTMSASALQKALRKWETPAPSSS